MVLLTEGFVIVELHNIIDNVEVVVYGVATRQHILRAIGCTHKHVSSSTLQTLPLNTEILVLEPIQVLVRIRKVLVAHGFRVAVLQRQFLSLRKTVLLFLRVEKL